MFHSKEVKQQLEQASQIKAQSQEYVRVLGTTREKVAEAQVEIDQLGMSATKMDRSLTKVVDFARDTKETADKAQETLEEVKQQMSTAREQLDVICGAYAGGIDFAQRQQEALHQLQEQSKRYTGLSKTLAEISGREHTGVESLIEDMKQLHSFEGTISTLALQAAIDAGRMGEEGTPFIHTAEEIRSLASDFAGRTEEMTGKAQQLLEEYREMDKRIREFIALLKENNISLGKLAAEAVRESEKETADVQALKSLWTELTDRHEKLSETVSCGRQHQEQIMQEMESIGSCYMEQQDSTGHMEEIIGDMKQMFSQIDFHNDLS
ncbi:MAG: methyl-accepting chemotaxis protein [Lachnospiraceae bacterium]|nr:methyl-accepting chemotaxis protein [Lachnospiraceae bacterium]